MCGDHMATSTLNGALESGVKAAKEAVKIFTKRSKKKTPVPKSGKKKKEKKQAPKGAKKGNKAKPVPI